MSEDILSQPPPPYDLRLGYGSDPNQFIDFRFPPQRGKNGPSPLVMNVHGGFWRAKYSLEHAGHLCAGLTLVGLTTANVEYRRVGNTGGGWPETFEDIRSAYQFLVQNAQKHGFSTEKIVVMGHSAGAQLALCLASHERCGNGRYFFGGSSGHAASVSTSSQQRCSSRVSARDAKRSSGSLSRG